MHTSRGKRTAGSPEARALVGRERLVLLGATMSARRSEASVPGDPGDDDEDWTTTGWDEAAISS